jgi:hypothetical protein
MAPLWVQGLAPPPPQRGSKLLTLYLINKDKHKQAAAVTNKQPIRQRPQPQPVKDNKGKGKLPMRFAKALLIQTSTSETAGLDDTSPVQDNSDVVMEESAQEDSFTSAIDHTKPQWKSVLENESEIETDSDVEDRRQPFITKLGV